ncbi:MAG: YhdP family protein [Pseudomonadota bacterium]
MIANLLKKTLSSLLTACVAVLLLLAVYVSLGRQLLPYVVNYRADIESRLSAEIGQQVRIGALSGAWNGLNPLLSLQQVLISPLSRIDTAQALLIDDLSLEVDVFASVFARRLVLGNVDLRGPEFTVLELDNGRWQLQGFAMPSEPALTPDQLLDMVARFEALSLSDVTFTVQRRDGRRAVFERSRLQMRNRGEQHFLVLDIVQGDSDTALSIIAELSGNTVKTLSGEIYVSVPQNDYSELAAGTYADVLQLQRIEGSAELWLNFSNGQLDTLQGNANLPNLALSPAQNSAQALTQPPSQPFTQPLSQNPTDVVLNDIKTHFFVRRNSGTTATADQATQSWELWLNDLSFQWEALRWRESDLYVSYSPEDAVHLLADSFNLGVVTGLINRLDVLAPAVDTQLAEHNPRGELRNLDLLWLPGDPAPEAGGQLTLSANLDDVSFSARGSAPALWGVDGYGELAFDAAARKVAGTVEVDSSRFMIQLPQLFNDAWAYDYVNGRVKFALDMTDGQHLRLASSTIVAESAAVDGRAQFATEYHRTAANERSSTLELMVGALQADVSSKSLYLPRGPMMRGNLRNLMDWLDGAVLGGTATQSGVIYRGSVMPGSTPEEKTLQMYYNVDGGALRFDSQWPVLENLLGHVVISDRNVDIDVESGQSLGIGFDATTASIRPGPDGAGSWLTVNGRGQGLAQQGLRYLQETPVTRGFGSYLANWQVTGDVGLNLELRIPLGQVDVTPQVNVSLALLDNSLFIPEFDLNFAQLGGQLRFNTQSGLLGEALQATLFDRPVSVDIKSETDALRGTATVVELTGRTGLQALRDWPRQSAFVRGLLRRAAGEMDYLARLDVVQPVAADAGTSSPALQRRLSISSNLQGVTLDYPQPLGKESATALPLNLSIDFLSNGQDLSVSLGQLGSMNISLAQGLVRNGLVFLGRRDEGLTVRRLDANAPGLDVIGQLSSFNYDEWMTALRPVAGLAGAAEAESAANFSSLRDAINAVDVTLGQAVVFGQTVDDLNLQIASEERDWLLSLASETVAGEVRVPYRFGVPLDVHLTHLHLPEPGVSIDLQAVLKQVVMDAGRVLQPRLLVLAPEPVERIDPLLAFDPRRLPRLRFVADEVRRGDADFGSWQFTLEPTESGAEFTDLIVAARGLQAGREGEEARFLWNFDGTSHHSYLNTVLHAGNIAGVLSAFGYAPSLESNSAEFHANLDWPGSPAFFAVTDLHGDMDMKILDGRFQQGGAGAANSALKLISIINFDALVRRLRFSDDLFSSGLSYDQINGVMTLDKGIVNIEDRLQIIGPASLFQVTGRLDLVQQTIDGSLYITLPVSDNIPWMSGIAVLNNLINWQVAVGVFLFDQIFGDQVDSLTSAQYTLQGPWEGLEPRLNQVFGTPSQTVPGGVIGAGQLVPGGLPATTTPPQNPPASQ